jgi:hypothetical protein
MLFAQVRGCSMDSQAWKAPIGAASTAMGVLSGEHFTEIAPATRAEWATPRWANETDTTSESGTRRTPAAPGAAGVRPGRDLAGLSDL